MRLVFAGTPQLAADALQELAEHHEIVLVITREDAPVGRKQVITPSPVAQVAQELNLEVLKTNKIAADELGRIAAANADLAVVVAFGAILPMAALELLNWWNVHFSLLPFWRGATPLQHSMIHQLGQGVTVFELEAGLDTGPIVASRPLEIGTTETAQEALARFTLVGVELVLEALKVKPRPVPQSGEVTLAPKIARSAAKIDFSLPADHIARTINALNPEPSAWANLDGSSIKLLRAKPLGNINWGEIGEQLTPGEVNVQGGRVLVGCQAGTQFELLELQPAGKKPMAAGDWIRGQSKAVKFD